MPSSVYFSFSVHLQPRVSWRKEESGRAVWSRMSGGGVHATPLSCRGCATGASSGPWLCVCDYAFSQTVFWIRCFANCISEEAFFSFCWALWKLAPRLIVTQEGRASPVLCLLVLGVTALLFPPVSG